MMKWWFSEIRLQNFLLNLNEKIHKPIFAKRIRPKYFQNLQMVLIMFCNGDKICGKKKCLRYFGRNIFPKIFLSHPITEDQKTKSPKTDYKCHRKGASQSSGTAMCWTCLCQQCRCWKVIDDFSSEKVRPRFFFQPMFMPNNASDLFWIFYRK